MTRRWRVLGAFVRARRRRRWSRAQIERQQRGRLGALPGLASAATVEEALARLPLTTPREFAAQFASRNALGLTLDEARALARAELAAGEPQRAGFSLGLSTGTTGEPGVFLTTEAERNLWVGSVLGKFFSTGELLRVALGRGSRCLEIALLLKHDNRLYGDVAVVGRARLSYFDLSKPVDAWSGRLRALAPDVLIGPPSVLLALAREGAAATGRSLAPRLLISVAEPLFPGERSALAGAFGVAPRPLYQAREGFLAAGCVAGRMHLNEDLIAFEALPFRDDPTRFVPVITDFTRRSERYWRCRVDDVLRFDPRPCPCGSRYAGVEVEGRLQDVLLRQDGSPVFPFELDAVVAAHLDPGSELVLTQHDRTVWTLACEAVAPPGLRPALAAVLSSAEGPAPTIEHVAWTAPIPAEKRRRFRRAFDPESLLLSPRLEPPHAPWRERSRAADT